MAKHSGADWLQRDLKLTALSPLGVRVANVLGQVELGIYHMESHLRGKRGPDWTNDTEIVVTRSQELASFDGPDLTMLLLSARAARLSVDISSHFKDLIRLSFKRQPFEFPEPTEDLPEGCLVEDFIEAHALSPVTKWDREATTFGLPKKQSSVRWAYWTAGVDGLDNVKLSVSTRHLGDRIPQMLIDAHQARIRLAFSGLSPSTMAVQLSRRQTRQGLFSKRHPEWDAHQEKLKPYWDIDYDSTT